MYKLVCIVSWVGAVCCAMLRQTRTRNGFGGDVSGLGVHPFVVVVLRVVVRCSWCVLAINKMIYFIIVLPNYIRIQICSYRHPFGTDAAIACFCAWWFLLFIYCSVWGIEFFKWLWGCGLSESATRWYTFETHPFSLPPRWGHSLNIKGRWSSRESIMRHPRASRLVIAFCFHVPVELRLGGDKCVFPMEIGYITWFIGFQKEYRFILDLG